MKGQFRQCNFTQVSNEAIRDNRLSLKAKGLYSLIASYLFIPDWILYKSYLMKQCSEGETAFNSAWNELKKAGYLIQYKLRDTKGGFIYEYELKDKVDEVKKETAATAAAEVEPIENKIEVVADEVPRIIEENTHLKLTKHMKKKVIEWEEARVYKAISIFKEKRGMYFSFLEKIYKDNKNYIDYKITSGKTPFNDYQQREYTDQYYKDLESKLLGWA